MFKKGPLRKLIDFLSSHRQKLVDSLAYNLKTCIQKGAKTSWMTGLIIMERIIMMGGQGTASRGIDKLENILRNKGQNSSFTDSERMKTELRTLKTESEK
jgi:hypothetical protein